MQLCAFVAPERNGEERANHCAAHDSELPWDCPLCRTHHSKRPSTLGPALSSLQPAAKLARTVKADVRAGSVFASQDISGFSALNEHFAQQGGEGLGCMMNLVNMYFQQVSPRKRW